MEQSRETVRDSGKTGGAANGRGVDFQTDFAVYVALDLLSELTTDNPVAVHVLRIEPRFVAPDVVTRWDIDVLRDADNTLTPPDKRAYEVKVEPTVDDVRTWLARAVKQCRRSPSMQFCLVYAVLRNEYLEDLETVLRLANEAGDDLPAFHQLLTIERGKHILGIAIALGPDPLRVAPCISTWLLPERALDEAVAFRLRFVMTPDRQASLRSTLASTFLKGMKSRKSYPIATLLRQLDGAGLKLLRASSIVPRSMSATLQRALFVLQVCPGEVPLCVIADSAGVEPAQLLSAIGKEAPQAIVVKDDFLYRNSKIVDKITVLDEGTISGTAISSLLGFIKAHGSCARMPRHIDNLIALADHCKVTNPVAASSVFHRVEKRLKRAGRKRDVLALAKLTTDAARRAIPRDTTVVRAEAQALICGMSWTYQRVGQLAQADVYANDSLLMCDDWPRNIAFCQKCIGRLRRVQSERTLNAKERIPLLTASTDLLGNAMKTFRHAEDVQNKDEEIGDCQSLLARTYFRRRMIDKAIEHAGIARTLLTDHQTKHYMDLILLEAEIAIEALDVGAADEKSREALSLAGQDDAERSEIAARAHLFRGMNGNALGLTNAPGEIQQAIDTWRRLGEHYNMGEARWQLALLEDQVPATIEAKTRKYEPSIRVEIARVVSERLRGGTKAIAFRDDIPDKVWKGIVDEAKANDAVLRRLW